MKKRRRIKQLSMGTLKFAKLVDDEHKFKNDYEQIESSFYTVYNAILELKIK